MSISAADLQTVYDAQLRFLRERNWGSDHSYRNLRLALYIEATELAETIQWSSSLEDNSLDPHVSSQIVEECCDVLLYALQLHSVMSSSNDWDHLVLFQTARGIVPGKDSIISDTIFSILREAGEADDSFCLQNIVMLISRIAVCMEKDIIKECLLKIEANSAKYSSKRCDEADAKERLVPGLCITSQAFPFPTPNNWKQWKEDGVLYMGLDDLRGMQRAWVKERDWDQFHTVPNLTLALGGEIGELAECFQWSGDEEKHGKNTLWRDSRHWEHFSEECADVLLYLLRLSDKACNVPIELKDMTRLQVQMASMDGKHRLLEMRSKIFELAALLSSWIASGFSEAGLIIRMMEKLSAIASIGQNGAVGQFDPSYLPETSPEFGEIPVLQMSRFSANLQYTEEVVSVAHKQYVKLQNMSS